METLVLQDAVCEIYNANIHIKDSYKIKSKRKMQEILYDVKHYINQKGLECKTFLRSDKSLIAEWRTHNRLYKLGYKRERTADVDLNYPLKWYVELAYRILGI